MPTVWGIVALVRQLVSNLLGNAVKYVAPGTWPAEDGRAGTFAGWRGKVEPSLVPAKSRMSSSCPLVAPEGRPKCMPVVEHRRPRESRPDVSNTSRGTCFGIPAGWHGQFRGRCRGCLVRCLRWLTGSPSVFCRLFGGHGWHDEQFVSGNSQYALGGFEGWRYVAGFVGIDGGAGGASAACGFADVEPGLSTGCAQLFVQRWAGHDPLLFRHGRPLPVGAPHRP